MYDIIMLITAILISINIIGMHSKKTNWHRYIQLSSSNHKIADIHILYN